MKKLGNVASSRRKLNWNLSRIKCPLKGLFRGIHEFYFRRNVRQNRYKSFTVSPLFFSVVLYLTYYNQIRCCLSSIKESKLEEETIFSKTWNENFEIRIPLNTRNVEYHHNTMKEFKRWVDHFEGKWQILTHKVVVMLFARVIVSIHYSSEYKAGNTEPGYPRTRILLLHGVCLTCIWISEESTKYSSS